MIIKLSELLHRGEYSVLRDMLLKRMKRNLKYRLSLLVAQGVLLLAGLAVCIAKITDRTSLFDMLVSLLALYVVLLVSQYLENEKRLQFDNLVTLLEVVNEKELGTRRNES